MVMMAVAVRVPMALFMAMVVAAAVLVVVVVGHWSIPWAGSAMCSSISVSTPLMCASAVE